MKRIILIASLLMAAMTAVAQDQITDKGYFYSPQGFACSNGSLYTADMKTLVRAGYRSVSPREDIYFVGYIVEVPSGAEVVPSNMVYAPQGRQFSGDEGSCYAVVLPSSVKYIATDAFMSPFVLFFAGESAVNAVDEVRDDDVKELARFNVQGQRLSGPQPGVNVVLRSDGTARRELVR